MLDTNAAREALARILKAGTGLTAYTAPDVLNPPCFHVGFASIEGPAAFGLELDRVRFDVDAIAPRSNDRGAIRVLDELLTSSSPRSVGRLLMADQTLEGTASGVVVRSGTPGTVLVAGGNEMPAVRFVVEVFG